MTRLGLSGLKRRNGIDAKALGRGIGSGCGKTSSYGHKGGKARSGRGKVVWFEGGQMPLYRRLPKRGFVSRRDKSAVAYVNLSTLQKLCETGVFADNQEVTIDSLKTANIVKKNAQVLRLLAKGELKKPLNIIAAYASDAAMKGVEAAGGKVQIVACCNCADACKAEGKDTTTE